MNIISESTDKAQYLAAFEPIEPGSEKHRELIDWYRERGELNPAFTGMMKVISQETDPEGLGSAYGMVFAKAPNYPDVEHPAWAIYYEDAWITAENNPGRLWTRQIIAVDDFTATIARDDVYNIDEGKVIEGEIFLAVNFLDYEQIDFTTPARARAAAQQLLAAADEFDNILAGA